MDLLEFLRYKGLEGLGRFYSIYRGVVVDNVDEKNLNLIKIKVPEIMSDARWAYPFNQQGSLGHGSKLITPGIGDVVWVMFEKGDPQYPTWSYCGWANSERPTVLSNNNHVGFITPNGNLIIIDDDTNTLDVVMKIDEENTHSVKINPESISLNTSKPININNTESTIEVIAKGDISIKSEGKTFINGENIVFNDGTIGTTQTDILVEKYNLLVKDLNTLKQNLTKALAAAKPNDGGKSAFAVFVAYNSSVLKELKLEEVEHKTVKQ